MRVTVFAAAEAPTAVLLKLNVVGVRVTVGVAPVPVSVTFCGEPVALSATLMAADSAPDALGENVTVIVQLLPAATPWAQVLVCENEVAPVPVRVIPVTVIGAPPVLLRVMFLVAAEVPTVVPLKVRDVGDRAATGTVPEPLSVTFWGEPVALSAMAKAAERAPEALGVKVTVMAHIPLAATLVPPV